MCVSIDSNMKKLVTCMLKMLTNYVFLTQFQYCQCGQIADAKTQEDVLGSRPKLAAWMEAVENATNPHFEEVHAEIYAIAEQLEGSRKMAMSQELDSTVE